MPRNSAAQSVADEILTGHSQPARREANVSLAAAEPGDSGRRIFVPFDNEDLELAMKLMNELIAIAERDGITAAVEEVRRRAQTEELNGLAQYALKLFMTHYPPAREQLRFLPLEKRQPNLVLGAAAQRAGTAASLTASIATYPSSATPPEDEVSFWREDPLLNEHHEHWHLVYPTARPLGNRHGELFSYMHEQMIARYDAERLALGLARVEPYTVYTSAIPQGYDPGQLMLWTGAEWYTYGPRPAGAHLSDLTGPFISRPGAKLSVQTGFRDALTAAATTNQYSLLTPPLKVTIDNLGDTEEANAGSLDVSKTKYGNFHNDGHIHFMAFDNKQPYGVMADTATAVRDPIFFRWHKQVDDIFHTYQQTLVPYDFAQAPKARIRPGDIFLVTAASSAAEATAAFGGDHWDRDFASEQAGSYALTDELTTEMLTREIDAVDADGNPVKVPIDYLSHDDFSYILRVENLEAVSQAVAIRIFLAPEDQVEHREMWIEMDKFVYTLAAHERAVITRLAEESSVIRKPALKPANLNAQDEPDQQTDQAAWCDCGWPYTLLLPRSTKEGAPYRLFVMLCFGDEITLPPVNGCCSSISYCGLEGKDYPDKMEMGYPFNRPFPNGLMATIEGRPNMATRKLTIRWK
jgi:hypothetical protein